jgi:hypothetical protein
MPNNLLDWLFKHFDKEYDAHKWAQLVGVQIIDPDGWRKNAKIGELPIPPRSMDDEIGLEEFLWRLSPSTICPLPK